MISYVLFDFSTLSPDVNFLSSIAIILGAVFVIFQIRQNNKLVAAAAEQARLSAVQAKLSTDQMKQNHELSNYDMIMRLYEFANSAEVQSSWLTVLHTKISSYDEFERLPKEAQIAFFQIAALFESLGVLVERGIVKPEIVEDMFLTELAWETMKQFVEGARQKYGEEDNFLFFEKLYNRLLIINKGAGSEASAMKS